MVRYSIPSLPTTHETELAIVPAAYALAKARDARSAVAYVADELPEQFYPALAEHMRLRPQLFDESIRGVVLAYLDRPQSWREAENLFSAPALALRGFDPALLA